MASGEYAMQGRRRTMEDKAVVLQHPHFNIDCGLTDNLPRSFFAVYDGHAGYVAAEYCRRRVHVNLACQKNFFVDSTSALRDALLATENDFCSACIRRHLRTSSGTCAIVVYIEGSHVTIANIGGIYVSFVYVSYSNLKYIVFSI